MPLLPKPLRVAVVGRNTAAEKEVLARNGFRVVKANPELVVTVGGDGTILHSERAFPGVPKLCTRDSQVCFKCSLPSHRSLNARCGGCFEDAVEKIASSGKMLVKEEPKLEGFVFSKGGRRLAPFAALNDVGVHNSNPAHALRFKAELPGRFVEREVIGDGVVVSTPYGSTAYFRSIARRSFSKGFGIAFSNPTRPVAPRVVPSLGAGVKITILRRSAVFVADNNPKLVRLAEGDRVVVRESKEKARFVVV